MRDREFNMLRRELAMGLIACAVVFTGPTGCNKNEEAKKISLEKREVVDTEKEPSPRKSLRFAVGAMITPREGFGYYRQLLDYIGKRLDRRVELVDRDSYAEINDLIGSGDIDVAFVCGQPYVDGHDEIGSELLVAPQMYGKTVYHSYIIVPEDSPVERFEGLRGKTFAFVDPMSNSGKLVPLYMLAKRGEAPESYFRKYVYTYAHDKSIKAVAQGIVDGAAVDHLIWEHLNTTHPELTAKTRVIEKSPPYGIPPVVVHSALDPELKERMRQLFLSIHEDKKGREILKGMMIDKFVGIDDRAYDSIREMKVWLAAQGIE